MKRGGSDDKENFSHQNYNDKRLRAELDKIEIPRDIMYMIDKVVRKRMQKVLVDENFDDELLETNKLQRMVEGLSSNSKANNMGDDLIPEKEISPEGAVRRINSVCARAASTMVPASMKGLNLSNDKCLEDPNIFIQSVRNISFEQW